MIQAKSFNGSIDRNGEKVLFDVLGQSSIAVQLSGTFSATIEFEGSINGSTFYAIPLAPPSTGAEVTSATTTGLYTGSIAGLKFFRVRCSAYTSGTATVNLNTVGSGGKLGVQSVNLASQIAGEDLTNNVMDVAPKATEYASLSVGSLNGDLFPSTDVSIYRSLSLHITSSGSGTITIQGSNDNVNFATVNATKSNDDGSGRPNGQLTSTGIYWAPVNYRYLRIRETSFSSGSFQGVLELYTTPYVATKQVAPDGLHFTACCT